MSCKCHASVMQVSCKMCHANHGVLNFAWHIEVPRKCVMQMCHAVPCSAMQCHAVSRSAMPAVPCSVMQCQSCPKGCLFRKDVFSKKVAQIEARPTSFELLKSRFFVRKKNSQKKSGKKKAQSLPRKKWPKFFFGGETMKFSESSRKVGPASI